MTVTQLLSGGGAEVIIECRRCGTTVSPDTTECLDCGATAISRYEI